MGFRTCRCSKNISLEPRLQVLLPKVLQNLVLIGAGEPCSTLGGGESVVDPLVDGEEVDPAVAVGLDVLDVPIGPHSLVLDDQLAE